MTLSYDHRKGGDTNYDYDDDDKIMNIIIVMMILLVIGSWAELPPQEGQPIGEQLADMSSLQVREAVDQISNEFEFKTAAQVKYCRNMNKLVFLSGEGGG